MIIKSFFDSIEPSKLDACAEGVAWLQGKLTPLRDAKISIMTHAFLYGTAVHEGIRGYRGDDERQVFIFRLNEHCDRLRRNCRVLRIDLPPAERVAEAIIDVVRANQIHSDCYIRAVAYKSGLQIGLRLSKVDDLAIFALPQDRFHATPKPLSVCISSWRRVQDNAIPPRAKINGAYVNSVLAMTDAAENGFDDAVLLSEDGHVSEGTGMNLFLRRNGRVITPPCYENILEGITRDTIIHLLDEELGISVESRPIDRTELYAADEVFFSGTGMEVVSVGAVDRRPVGDGTHELAERVRALYFDVARGKSERYAKWLAPVHAARKST